MVSLIRCFLFLFVCAAYIIKLNIKIANIVTERHTGLAARPNGSFKQRASHLLILKLPIALCALH